MDNANMSQQTLTSKLEAQKFPKVTPEMMKARIKDVRYMIFPDTTATICNLTLDNGYSVRGEASCVDKRNFDMAIGEKIAYDNAFRQLWPLFGFLLAESIFTNPQQ